MENQKKKLKTHETQLMIAWLECRDCDRQGLSLKPTCAIPLCSWERHLTVLMILLVLIKG